MSTALLGQPTPVDDATRRQFLTGAAAAALLAGCSRADPAAPAPPAGNGFPVTIDHRYGSTEIPAEPQRIVTVGLTDHDAVYALGKQPVAGELHVYAGGGAATSILEEVGFVVSSELDQFMSEKFGVPAISAERFDLIDVDLIVWDGDRAYVESTGIQDVPTFQRLDAVQDGRQVIPGTDVASALSMRSVLSIPWALERLEPQIIAAFDGDPATEVPA